MAYRRRVGSEPYVSGIEVVPRARFELARVGLEPTVLSVKLTEHSGETYVGEVVLIMAIHITEITKNVK